MESIRQFARNLRRQLTSLTPARGGLPITWQRQAKGSWLEKTFSGDAFTPPPVAREAEIEARAARTEKLGAQPLWDGYREVYSRDPTVPGARAKFERSSEQVRSQPVMGRFFAWLAARRKPGLVVEFGSAFGVSGMYWLAGLNAAGTGRLLTFEPNSVWQSIAEENLRAIGGRYTAMADTFEAAIDSNLSPGERIDIAFVDAIHTSEFVMPQFELLADRLAPNGLILLDDINFSSDMAECWKRLANDPRVLASAAFGGRVGLLEFPTGT